MAEIKAFREIIGATKEEFASILGFSLSYYEKIDCGDREPSRTFLKRINEKDPQFDLNIIFKA